MKITRMKPILLPILLLLSFSCAADKAPTSGRTDQRIMQVTYNSRDVVTITANYGISTMIEFAENEKVVTLSLGDALAWNITDNKNHIFVKPMEDHADTNMLVVTNQRVYNFALKAVDSPIKITDQNLTFTVRFRYIEDEQLIEQQKRKDAMPFASEVAQNHSSNSNDINMEYTFRGDKDIVPRRVFDDGKFTYFQFNDVSSEPAIFASDVNSEDEALVNFHRKGKYIVVQRLARKYVLRDGDKVTCVYNENYPLDYKQQIHIAEDTFFRSTPTPAPAEEAEFMASMQDVPPKTKALKQKMQPIFIPAPPKDETPEPAFKKPVAPSQPRIAPMPAPAEKIEWYKYD